MSDVERILRDVGPALSSHVAAALQQRLGLSANTARQRVARRTAPVQSLDLPFQRGATFLYLPHQYRTGGFVRALGDALEANSGAYARALQALGGRGGIMPKAHLLAAAGLGDASGQMSPELVVERLVRAEVLTELEVSGQGVCVAFVASDDRDELIHRMKARLVAEDVLLDAVREWARNLALGSFESFRLRNGPAVPTVGRFAWDMTAPSYLSGVTSWDSKASKPRPGFLVADALLGGEIDERAVRPFLYKCSTLRQMKSIRCLQVFLADSFSREALMRLREQGVIPGSVHTLFGADVAKALKALIAVLTQTAATAVDPAQFDILFASLGRFEGAAGRLRGALFEFVAAALLHEDGWHEIVINKLYRLAGKAVAEVDVRALKDDVLLFVECKGIAPGTVLDDQEVKDWLDRRIPVVVERTRSSEEHAHYQLQFELWVTGELSADAVAMIRARQEAVRPTRYKIDVRFGVNLATMATAHKRRQPALLAVLRDHFVASPLRDTRPWSSANLAPVGDPHAVVDRLALSIGAPAISAPTIVRR